MAGSKKTTVVAVTLIAAALIVGMAAVRKVMSRPAGRVVTVDAGAASRPVYGHRDSAALGQLRLLRQSAVEAVMPEDARRGALMMLDDYRTKHLALLDDQTLEATARDGRLKELRESFSRTLRESDDPTLNRAISATQERLSFIWFELDLLSRRRLLPLMFERLDLSEQQHKQADAAFIEVSIVLRNEPAGGAPNERSVQAMLTGREKLHALLTSEQREKFDQVLRDEQQARRQVRLSNRTTVPATRAK
jgi:hypothetical protein